MSTQASFCATLVDEWARSGITEAVAAPGSRSTPLVSALAADERINLHVRLDERSAAFAALGVGLASGRPAVLVTTSGTAAAEVHAAVVEAHQAGIPLLVCTADRPPELQQVGAPQTIDQQGLFGRAVRFELSVAVPEEGSRLAWRSMASRLVAETTGSPLGPGPVHLNLGLREPFTDDPGPMPEGRAGGAPWHQVSRPRRGGVGPELESLLADARRPLIVAGAGAGEPSRLLEDAGAAGWPLLADPRSGLRRSGPGDAAVVAAADSLLRIPSLRKRLRPDLIVRLGAPPASKVVNAWLGELASEGVVDVLVDPHGLWRDPSRAASLVVRGAPEELMEALGEARVEAPWAKEWSEAEEAAQAAIERTLGELEEEGELSEPLIARRVAEAGAGTVVVSSSMPVRDLEWYSRPSPSFPLVYSNRGANGIDGVSSTALGVGLGGAPGPVVGLLGDLAFLHDASALYRSAVDHNGSGSPVGLVVVDNNGGGIFSYLPQAASTPTERFEHLFGTPQEVDLVGLAAACGCDTFEVSHPEGLEEALHEFLGRLAGSPPGSISAVLICRVGRPGGPAVHDRLNEAVGAALGVD